MDKTWPKQLLFEVKRVHCRVHHALMKSIRLRNLSEFSFVSKIMLFPFNQGDVKQVGLCKLSPEAFSLLTTQRWITTLADFCSCKNCFARLELELQGLSFFPLVVWRITKQNISLLHFLPLHPLFLLSLNYPSSNCWTIHCSGCCVKTISEQEPDNCWYLWAGNKHLLFIVLAVYLTSSQEEHLEKYFLID